MCMYFNHSHTTALAKIEKQVNSPITSWKIVSSITYEPSEEFVHYTETIYRTPSGEYVMYTCWLLNAPFVKSLGEIGKIFDEDIGIYQEFEIISEEKAQKWIVDMFGKTQNNITPPSAS